MREIWFYLTVVKHKPLGQLDFKPGNWKALVLKNMKEDLSDPIVINWVNVHGK